MTKKHFKQLAQVIKDNTHGIIDTNTLYINRDDLVDELCVILKQVNPRFNTTMFKDACE